MRKSVLKRQRGLAPMEVVRFACLDSRQDSARPSKELGNEPLSLKGCLRSRIILHSFSFFFDSSMLHQKGYSIYLFAAAMRQHDLVRSPATQLKEEALHMEALIVVRGPAGDIFLLARLLYVLTFLLPGCAQ